ncbi:MAG: hypothetical protein C0501_00230 [Isosphaera sp.]|nr:hypothetical protein [Isosphaera sp.]
MRVLRSDNPRPLDLLAVGAGGHVAAACSAFGVRGDVDVWAATAAAPAVLRCGEREVNSLAFTPDAALLFVGEAAQVSVHEMPGELTEVWFGSGFASRLDSPEVAVSADGHRVAVAETEERAGAVTCYALTPGRKLDQLWAVGPDDRMYGDPAFSPDGSLLAVSVHDGFRGRVRNAVQVRDADTGKVLAEVEFGGANPLEQLAFSADGAKLLARSSGRTVKVFDAATGQPAGELVHPGRPYVTGAAVHPSGTVACSRTNGTVCLWDLARGELVRTLDWKLGKLVAVAFSPDGSVGAAGTEDGRVVVWDVDE